MSDSVRGIWQGDRLDTKTEPKAGDIIFTYANEFDGYWDGEPVLVTEIVDGVIYGYLLADTVIVNIVRYENE